MSAEPDFVLGSMTVQPSLREVSWDTNKEQLEPRVMQVLVALARADGGVVSRDELIRLCWEGRIVGEAAINRCILKLRDLADAVGKEAFRRSRRFLASDTGSWRKIGARRTCRCRHRRLAPPRRRATSFGRP